MYSTCLFCSTDLGRNEVVEELPVGRRVAFDAAKGRLWIVCRRCARWNLTPMEERWEAIERCEREFRATRTRVSTDNIGLARLREGLELVRIGQPLRPEFAAWRYGDLFRSRYRRYLVTAGVGVGAAMALKFTAAFAGVALVNALLPVNLHHTMRGWWLRRVTTSVRLGDGEPLLLRGIHAISAELLREGKAWRLRVPLDLPGGRTWYGARRKVPVEFTGEDAVRIAARVLPYINASGARKPVVEDAVRFASTARDLDQAFHRVAADSDLLEPIRLFGSVRYIAHTSAAKRLGLEMLLHEDLERRALEGELALLEQAWRDAEEVAKIADDLLLPADVPERIERLRDAR